MQVSSRTSVHMLMRKACAVASPRLQATSYDLCSYCLNMCGLNTYANTVMACGISEAANRHPGGEHHRDGLLRAAQRRA